MPANRPASMKNLGALQRRQSRRNSFNVATVGHRDEGSSDDDDYMGDQEAYVSSTPKMPQQVQLARVKTTSQSFSAFAESTDKVDPDADSDDDDKRKEPLCACWRKPAAAKALDHDALLCLSGDNCLRVLVYNVTKSRIFEFVIIMVILANCVFLALDDPTVAEEDKPAYVFTIELAFACIYTAEMLLKIVALGFFAHEAAYLRDRWNVLDFIIVILTWLSFVPGFGNYSVLRVLRVLRPLRSMNAFKGLKTLVVALFRSFAGLWPVLLLAFIIFTIFGIVGVQLWSGAFRQQCRATTPPNDFHPDARCRIGAANGEDGLLGVECPPGYECVPGSNPNYGFVNFDNAAWATLLVFQVITFEGWPSVLLTTYQTSGTPSFLYFFLLILVGSYFIPNLALAVINEKYQHAVAQQHRAEAKEARRATETVRRNSAVKLFSAKASAAGTGGGTTRVVNPLADVGTTDSGTDDRRKRTVSIMPAIEVHEDALDEEDTATDDATEDTPSCWLRFRNWLHLMVTGLPLPELEDWSGNSTHAGASIVPADGGERPETTITPFTALVIFFIFANTVLLAAQHHEQPQWLDEVTVVANIAFTCIFALELTIVLCAVGFKRFFTNGFYVLDFIVVVFSILELFLTGGSVISVFRALRLLRVLKLLRNFPTLQSLVAVMLHAVRDTLYLNVVLFLLLFVFALAGMQFFGGEMRKIEQTHGVPVRAHFDTFYNAFYTVFQVVTLDNWINIMWNAMEATNVFAAFFFVLLVLVGTYLVLNLFLSILIQGFQNEGDVGDIGDDADEALRQKRAELQEFVVVSHGEQHLGAYTKSGAASATPMSNALGDKRSSSTHLRATRSQGSMGGGAADGDRPSPLVRVSSAAAEELAATFGHVNPTVLARALQSATERKAAGGQELLELLDSGITCSECGCNKLKVLQAPPFERRQEIPELHEAQCWLAALRRKKEIDLTAMLALVGKNMQEDNLLTVSMSEQMLETAQSRGFFSTLTALDLRSWFDIEMELREELDVVRLAVGEEQIGRAHIGYVHAGVKMKHRTNGGIAFFCLGPENAFRVAVSELVHHPAFDYVVLLLIVASSTILIVDSPQSDLSATDRQRLAYVDLAFSIVFACEIVLRALALGLWMHPGSYLRSGWNWLDLVSVAVSFVTILTSLRAIRVLRFLRPLRTIKRYRGLRLVVATIVNSIKGIMNVVLLSSINYLIFAILAVQLFSGKLYSCTDPTIVEVGRCNGPFTAVQEYDNGTLYNATLEREWRRFDRNFDHIGFSLMSLFQVSSGDDWADIMYAAIDAVSVSHAPERDAHPEYGLFFIAFFIVSYFFLLNLFVGVVIVNFSRVKEKVDGLAFLTEDQRVWVESQRAMLNMRPEIQLLDSETAAMWRKRLDAFVRSPAFELFVGACITLNVIAIGAEYEGQSDGYGTVLLYINTTFVLVYIVEAVLKILAHGVRYFYLGWNRFDFLLVLVSIADVILTFLASDFIPINVQLLRVLRFVRILRVLRLFKKARRVRVLVETLWYSLPSIGNIALLMFIVYFVFAVIGMQLFGRVAPGRFINKNFFHFGSFQASVQLLFIFTTNEKWSDAMYDCSKPRPGCDFAEDGGCGTEYAPIYFTIFVVASAFVITNLFLAIILDNFATTVQMDNSSVTLSDLHRFTDIWGMHDTNATLLMPTRYLPKLLASLQPPLGTIRSDDRISQLHRMTEYRILDHNGYVHFAEVLVPLARRVVAGKGNFSLHNLDLTRTGFPELDTLPTVWFNGRPAHVGHTMAATFVAASYRRHLALRKVAKLREEKQAIIAAFKHAPKKPGQSLSTSGRSHAW